MPLAWDGFVYVAARNGTLYKVVDGATLSFASGPWASGVVMAGQAVLGSPAIDVVNNALFVGVNYTLWSVRLADGFARSISLPQGQYPCTSSPFVDLATMSVFIGHGARIWRVSYDATAAFTGVRAGSVRVSDPTTLDDPKSSPLVFSPSPGTTYAYIGDSGGYLNRYTASALGSRSTFPAGNTGVGGKIESPIVMDYTNGNVYFGADNGRVYQVGQVSLQ
jgi:hypothetical protein